MSSLFVPNAVISASGAATSREQAAASDYFFFDERFAEAHRLAGELSGITVPTPVQGDVTPTWIGLSCTSLAAPMMLRGVTTESFYFCLKILLLDQVQVAAQVRRFDGDLHLWTIRTDNHFKNGAVSWQNLSRPA
jgi:hypothetical protein